MSYVNVDPKQVTNLYMDCMTYLQIVKQSKSDLYNQLSSISMDWNDNKYVQLQDLVTECVSSLNKPVADVERISQGLAKLLNALSEYEANGFANGGVNSTSTSSGGNSFWNSCCGVRINSHPLSLGYRGILNKRYKNSEESVRMAFEKFVNSLVVQETALPYGETPHYTSGYPDHPRGVYYNANDDTTNARGEGSTFFHEIGHMVDNAATGYQGNISNNTLFANALIQDAQDWLNYYNSHSPEDRNALDEVLFRDSSHSFSDLIDGLTGGRLSGRYGHGGMYWSREGSLQAEAFAHFFEASMGSEEKLELLRNAFPNAYGIFLDMINSINGTSDDTNIRNQILLRR